MVKSMVARSSNNVKAGESAQKELVAVAISPSSGVQHSGPSILPGSGSDQGVARAQGSPDGGSNPEDVSLTLPTGETSFNASIFFTLPLSVRDKPITITIMQPCPEYV